MIEYFVCDKCIRIVDISQMHTCPSCNEYVCDKCWNDLYDVCQECIDKEDRRSDDW